jgi:hypothetical protein
MRDFFLAALLLLGFESSVAAARAEWVTYPDPKGAFTVEVPRAPKISEKESKTESGRPFHQTTYLVNDTDVQLIVLVAEHDEALSNKSLDDIADAVAGDDLTLVSKQTITVDGYEGRLATLTDTDGFRYEFRFLVAGTRLYEVMWVKPKDPTDAQSADALRFSNSFHITK